MVTIFMYSLSFGQNSNDCNFTPNKAEFSDFIKFDENKNVKSLNLFIATKKNEKAELESSKDVINKNSHEYNDRYGYFDYYDTKNNKTEYDLFKIYKDQITSINLLKDSTKISVDEYNALKTIKSLIHNNIDIYNVEEKKDNDSKNINSRNTQLKNSLEALVFKEVILKTKSDTTTDNDYSSGTSEKQYKIKSQNLQEFIKNLYLINASDFNNCEVIIKNNLNNVYKDIETAENYLNDLSSRELTEFSFKKHIMVIVGALIAIILVCFFTGVLYKATDAVKQKLIGETGLQFITIFVIIIAVILFGVMNILKGSELAAILSAIAGYILGKTAPPKSDKTLEIELEILKLKSEEAQRLKQEKDKKVAEAAEAIKKQEEEKRKLEIEAENKKLEAEEIQDDINPDTTTNDSVKVDVDQVAEILSEDTDVNTIEKSDQLDESDESYDGIDEKK